MTDSGPMIGIAFPSPIDGRTWSGIPAGLTRGLDARGARVTHLTGPAVDDVATRSAEAAEALSEEIGRAVRAAGHLDGVVQIGSTFRLPGDLRYVTFEDATVAQALPVLELPREDAERWRRRQHECYSRATACCVASRWAARSVADDYAISTEKIHVVGFGANVEAQPPPDKDFDVPRFLFVGKDWRRKNGPAVIRAFAAVRRDFPSATLDLVGSHPDLADVPGVTGHGPLDHSTVSGRRSLEHLFRKATCFVLPSRFDPFGIAYVEAGCAGVPSIGTSVGGAEDAIGAGGVLVDPGDEGALRDAMLEHCDPATARRRGVAARENASKYTWTRVAERVLRALDRAFESDGSAPVGASCFRGK